MLPEDLVKFGMIPEFIGRMPMIGAVRSLDAPSLVRILTEPKNALVRQYQKVFEFEDVELEFSDDGLQAIADLALLRGTGARGLRALLEEVLLNTMYDLPGRTDIGRVVIDADTVREKTNPTLVPRETHAHRPAPPRRILSTSSGKAPPFRSSSSGAGLAAGRSAQAGRPAEPARPADGGSGGASAPQTPRLRTSPSPLRRSGAVAEDRHGEVGGRCPRPQVPGGEAMLDEEAGVGHAAVERVEGRARRLVWKPVTTKPSVVT